MRLGAGEQLLWVGDVGPRRGRASRTAAAPLARPAGPPMRLMHSPKPCATELSAGGPVQEWWQLLHAGGCTT